MCANWVGDNRDMSPERNDRYRIDDVGLQIRLGFPLQIVGVSLPFHFNRSRQNGGGRGRGHPGPREYQNRRNRPPHAIKQTVDGIPIRKIYVSNIDIEVQRHHLYHIFGSFGPIMNVYLGVSRNDQNKQFAFITFANPLDAARVLSIPKLKDMNGRPFYINAADSWHQPREGPNGQIQWRVNRKIETKQENEEDEEQMIDLGSCKIETDILEGSLNMLNDDCLMHIFSFLSFKEITAVERVCKRWQALSFRMWRCLHELRFNAHPFNKMDRNTPLLEQYLRRCGDSLRLLDLTVNNHAFNESTLAVIAKYCSNLEVLRVSNIHVGNRSIAHLGRCCHKLKEIVMEGCFKLTDKDLLSLLPKCPDLGMLDLTRIDGFTGKCLVSVKGPITNLSLASLSKINSRYLVMGLQKMSTTLDTLTLSACNLQGSEVKSIVDATPNLTSFTLCRCVLQIHNQTLSHIGRLSKLTYLNLHLNSAVNDTALAAIVDGCEQLTKLVLSGCGGGCAGVLSDRGLSMLSRLRKLTDLDISYLEAANNTALKNISSRNTKLKNLVCRGCPELSDEGILPIITMCNDLELLDLSGCHNVGSGLVETAITSVKMRTNNTPLKMILGGTNVTAPHTNKEAPLLALDFADLSEDHLRPDFIDDMFFPPSDSDDEEDLDHLCCDCDFEFDDLFDPTLAEDDIRTFQNSDDYWDNIDNWDSEDDFDDDQFNV